MASSSFGGNVVGGGVPARHPTRVRAIAVSKTKCPPRISVSFVCAVWTSTRKLLAKGGARKEKKASRSRLEPAAPQQARRAPSAPPASLGRLAHHSATARIADLTLPCAAGLIAPVGGDGRDRPPAV